MIEILISYAVGTDRMLRTCLESLARHDAGEDYRMVVLTGDEQAFEEAKPLAYAHGATVCQYAASSLTSSGRHAKMLDAAVADSKADYVLTLDSDCFPVADGWLSILKEMTDGEVSGIVWPWKPPEPSLDKKTMEWRIRRQHCWENTQVACQLLPLRLVRDMALKFADPAGDDNNFGLMDKLHAAGVRVEGLMPTHCAVSDDSKFDAELNRHVCVIYGSLMYHHGGASREKQGAFVVDDNLFGAARRRVLDEHGAEWILEPGNHHAYQMDREDEVVAFKMDLMMRMAVTMLQRQKAIFGEWI